MQDATRKVRDANRALDIAIYADALSEDDVQARLREFQASQAEVARLRFQSEVELRKILTPEQLGQFRALRERFGRARAKFARKNGERDHRDNAASTAFVRFLNGRTVRNNLYCHSEVAGWSLTDQPFYLSFSGDSCNLLKIIIYRV